jgi:hypothetical protein
VHGVLDVARQGDHGAGSGGVDGGPGGLQVGGAPGVDRQVPAVGGQPLGERSPESPAGTGDDS